MSIETRPVVRSARVIRNRTVCREHLRMTLGLAGLPNAQPGQFVHLGQPIAEPADYVAWEAAPQTPCPRNVSAPWRENLDAPLLRRAFSIADLRPGRGSTELDVIYRVVGSGTRWLSRLSDGGEVSLLGPLGRPFPIRASKRAAWLVAGGVGLPPMLWLAQALDRAGQRVVAFCGARSADLLPLTLEGPSPARDGTTAVPGTTEFNASATPVVVSTDDGSLGYCGHIGAALRAYHAANRATGADLILYTCGPEVMMRGVAEFALAEGIECHVCMERSMACGLGTCQSCVLPVRDETDRAGWRFSLCCTEGPVYEASTLLWDIPAREAPALNSGR